MRLVIVRISYYRGAQCTRHFYVLIPQLPITTFTTKKRVEIMGSILLGGINGWGPNLLITKRGFSEYKHNSNPDERLFDSLNLI